LKLFGGVQGDDLTLIKRKFFGNDGNLKVARAAQRE